MEALEDVEDSDVAGMLGFPLVTKAEPYAERLVAQDPVVTHSLMGALIVSAFVIVFVVMALLFLLHRANRAGLSLKHSRLLGSPDHTTMDRSDAQTSPASSVSFLKFPPNLFVAIFSHIFCLFIFRFKKDVLKR